MSRTIYLIIYNSPLFPAHWALWIPTLEYPNFGKRIHAEGNAATGFELSFDRNYDRTQESRKHDVLVLAEVDARHLVDTPGQGSDSVDRDPQDDIETVAAQVPVPGPSLVSAATRTTTARGTNCKVDIKNCLTWLAEVVDALHEKGIFHDSAVEVIETAPKN